MSGLASTTDNVEGPIPAYMFDKEHREALIEKLQSTNINTETLLTTDYLNHFSAIFMILEMLPMDPATFAGDILAWEPRTYAEHMTESGFRDSELAIICYEYADRDIRIAFDKIIAQLEDATRLIIERLENALANERPEDIQQICDDAVPQMRQLVEHAASVVNGDKELIKGICAEEMLSEQDHHTSSQDEIDALFG